MKTIVAIFVFMISSLSHAASGPGVGVLILSCNDANNPIGDPGRFHVFVGYKTTRDSQLVARVYEAKNPPNYVLDREIPLVEKRTNERVSQELKYEGEGFTLTTHIYEHPLAWVIADLKGEFKDGTPYPETLRCTLDLQGLNGTSL